MGVPSSSFRATRWITSSSRWTMPCTAISRARAIALTSAGNPLRSGVPDGFGPKRAEIPGIRRFGQCAARDVDVARDRLAVLRVLSGGREDEAGQRLPARILSHRAQHIQPAHSRHFHINKSKIKLPPVKYPERCFCILCCFNQVVFFFKPMKKRFPDYPFIINY